MNKDQDEDEKESFKPPPKMMELPGMQQNVPTQAPSIPTANQVNPMPSYGSPPTPNLQDANANIDPATTPKVPNLQSNMFKMQRNKSNETQFGTL